MKRFTRILACTDFSDHGNAAIEAAFALCHDAATHFIVAHVIDTPATPNPLYAHYYPSDRWDPEALTKAESDARRELQALIPDEAQKTGLSIELVLGHGQPIQEILRLADDMQADVIVVGTHGRTGLSHLILGSVVERLVRMAKVPVLVTR